MRPQRFNRLVVAELDELRRRGLIDAAQYRALRARYPTVGWNWLSLGRWLMSFGAVASGTGLFLLGRQLFAPTLEKGALLCALALLAAAAGGWRLRRRGLLWAGLSLELLAGLLLVVLSFLLGAIFSSGSGNWPALLLIDLLLLLPLAYLRRNVLLLTLTAVVFFVWFGGVTGYSSGWGAYWFGMNYPLRFLLAGVGMAAVGVAHRLIETGALAAYRGFFKVWLSAGIFFAEMALWLLSLFGSYGEIWNYHRGSVGELLLFNLLWAGANAALLLIGVRCALRMLRGYAVTFLIIQGYTLFFWHIAGHLGPVLAAFLGGAGTLVLVLLLERRRRARAASGEPAAAG